MLVLDTSALLKRYIAETGTDTVLEAMTDDASWAASALGECEARVTLCHLGLDETTLQNCLAALDADWSRFHVVPVDDGCLSRAGEIGCQYRLRTLDAIHLASAERMPQPNSLLTFDRRQAQVGEALGFDVLGPELGGAQPR